MILVFRVFLVFVITANGFPAVAEASREAMSDQEQKAQTAGFTYGEKGLQYQSADGDNFLWFGVRLQTRYSNREVRQDLLPGQPTTTESDLKLNRGRLKLGGHLLTPKLSVYSEYDFTKNRLLDFRASYAFADWLSLRVGQWKSEYNRERIDSSGAQQFVERSIVTPWFTIDRQKGVVMSGRLAAGKAHDSSYWFGRLSGAGRGGSASDADGLWLGRYQWNFNRRVLGFSQSDIGKRQNAAGSVAIAFVAGYSRYTSFSGAGGGQLPGFTEGDSDQYRVRQVLLETAWQEGGFSWQQELHWKNIRDRVNNTAQSLVGGYIQAGMFFSEVWQAVPEPLEIALRFAAVDPNRGVSGDFERELTLAGNWFFQGHRNKLTADLSRIKRRMVPETETDLQFRLQWEWSF